MWLSCKTSFDTVPNRVKLMIKVMAFVALVLYLTLVLCQNVSGYQDLKVSFLCNNFLTKEMNRKFNEKFLFRWRVPFISFFQLCFHLFINE